MDQNKCFSMEIATAKAEVTTKTGLQHTHTLTLANRNYLWRTKLNYEKMKISPNYGWTCKAKYILPAEGGHCTAVQCTKSLSNKKPK